MGDDRRRHSVDFADEIAGRDTERNRARSNGWTLVLTIAAVFVIVSGFLAFELATAGLDPAAKRQDRLEDNRLTPAPLPKAFCTARAAGEAG